MRNKSYASLVTTGVKPYRAYEEDFTKSGDLIEKIEEEKINLTYQFHLGNFFNSEWNYANSPGSYTVKIYYRNKNHIEIIFNAHATCEKSYRSAFEFVKEVAKKFYLVNKHGRTKYLRPRLKWESIENIIRIIDPKTKTMKDALSWSKTMTLTEAKDLFKYMQIGITFPY